MKATYLLPNDPCTEMLTEETSSQFRVTSFHIVCSFMLLLGWVWVGSLLLG